METRKQDHDLTLRRTRRCANGHRFQTYEVLAPIYRRDPRTVRQTVVAAMVRAAQWRRDSEIIRALQTATHVAVAEMFNMKRQAVTAIARRRRQAKAATKSVSNSTANSKG